MSAYLARTATSFDPANAQTPDSAAEAIVAVLTAAEPPARAQTSDAARRFAGMKLADLDGSAVTSVTATWVASA